VSIFGNHSCLAIEFCSLESWPFGIDPDHPRLSIQQQCELLGVPRSTYYYQPRPESAENLRLLRRLDQLYLKRPFFGSRKMAVELEVNRNRLQRLMRILGIEAHYPKPNLGRPAQGHEVYPYLGAARGWRGLKWRLQREVLTHWS
jgi:putative transposase